MKNATKFTLLLFVILSFSQCRKDEIQTLNNSNYELDNSDNISFLLLIKNNNNDVPTSNVSLELADDPHVYYSDEDGFIYLKDLKVPKLGLRATFSIDGYYKQTNMLMAQSDSKNTQIIRMIPLKEYYPDLMQNTGEKFVLTWHDWLELPSSMEYEDGTPYEGPVTIIRHSCSNSQNEESSTKNLIALNESDELVMLKTLKTDNIQVFDMNNKRLYIPDGLKAKISFINSSYVQKDYNLENLKTWSLDETTGFSRQEGDVSIENGIIESEISHFTYVSFGIPHEFIEICMTIVNKNGIPIQGIEMNVRNYAQNVSDDEGKLCMMLPKDVEIKINPKKGKDITLGSFSSDMNNLEIVYENKYLNEFTGKAINCNGQPLGNGYAVCKSFGSFGLIPINKNGELSFLSGYQASATVFNVDNMKTKLVHAPILTKDESYEFGDIIVCDEKIMRKIEGRVMIDTNGDGSEDEGIEGIKVILIGPSKDSTLTDSEGYYSFHQPKSGSYILNLALQDHYRPLFSGDKSPDGDQGEVGQLNNYIPCYLNINEIDSDNDFLIIEKLYGDISGKVMVDADNDGVGDFPFPGLTIDFYNTIDGSTKLTTYQSDEYGFFQYEDIENITGELVALDMPFIEFISDYDHSPDPDGDDQNLGANRKIPFSIDAEENDEDNNFVITVDHAVISCRILLDNDMDGIGDKPVSGARVELYRRNIDTGNKIMPHIAASLTGIGGFVTFGGLTESKYVLEYIGKGTHKLIGVEDLIPDNNPSNTHSNFNFMPININSINEFDIGNTFIVK